MGCNDKALRTLRYVHRDNPCSRDPRSGDMGHGDRCCGLLSPTRGLPLAVSWACQIRLATFCNSNQRRAAVTCLLTGLRNVIPEEDTRIRRNVKCRGQYDRLHHTTMHMRSINMCETEWKSLKWKSEIRVKVEDPLSHRNNLSIYVSISINDQSSLGQSDPQAISMPNMVRLECFGKGGMG